MTEERLRQTETIGEQDPRDYLQELVKEKGYRVVDLSGETRLVICTEEYVLSSGRRKMMGEKDSPQKLLLFWTIPSAEPEEVMFGFLDQSESAILHEGLV